MKGPEAKKKSTKNWKWEQYGQHLQRANLSVLMGTTWWTRTTKSAAAAGNAKIAQKKNKILKGRNAYKLKEALETATRQKNSSPELSSSSAKSNSTKPTTGTLAHLSTSKRCDMTIIDYSLSLKCKLCCDGSGGDKFISLRVAEKANFKRMGKLNEIKQNKFQGHLKMITMHRN